MLTRILSAVVLIPLVVAVVLLAPPVLFSAAVTLLSLVAFGEFIRLRRGAPDSAPAQWPILTVAAACGFLVVHPLFPEHRIAGVVAFFLIAGVMSVLFGTRNEEIADRLVWPAAGFVYIFLLFSFTYDIRFGIDHALGAYLLLVFLLIQWLGDTFAYFVGTWMGRRKLAPRISPKKTVEGTLGGLLGSAVVGLAAWALLPPLQSPWPLVILAAALGALGQIGDLLESQFKRALGVKDSSRIIPGHGGLLDRLDSLVFTAPAFYLALQWCIASGHVKLG
jgi:phosphatidate cytidylyltransferase